MISPETIEQAIEIGKSKAQEVLEFRNRELQRREKAIQKAGPSDHIRTFEPKWDVEKLLGPQQARDVLIAEGDSWFDYPFHDVLRILEDHHGYDVESVAHKGDRIEEMAYVDGQLEELTRLIEKILRRSIVPRSILLSGGGNDFAGREFGMLLNHFASSIAGLNDSIVEGAINERMKMAYITIISKITNVCQQRIGQSLPILIHGYDYPVPDGRGFLGGWWFLPGPWLEPGFREKGFSQLQERIHLTKELINRFNEMLIEVASIPQFSHVHYIDLRGTLSTILSDYKDDWGNELHPTEDGFVKVTDRFAKTISSLP